MQVTLKVWSIKNGKRSRRAAINSTFDESELRLESEVSKRDAALEKYFSTPRTIRNADFTRSTLTLTERCASPQFVDCSFEHATINASQSTHFTGCDLLESTIDGSGQSTRLSFSGCNMAGVSISAENVQSVVFVGCDMAGIDVRGTIPSMQILSLGILNGYRVFAYDGKNGPRVRAGCRDFALDYARKYWSNRPERSEILASIPFIKKVAGLRDWTKVERA